MVVWTSEDPLEGLEGDSDIVFSRSVDNGANWSDPSTVDSTAESDSTSQSHPVDNDAAVATDGAGNWVVVWNSPKNLGGNNGGDDYELLFARSTNAGAHWSESSYFDNTYTQGSKYLDQNASIATDGTVWLVVWAVTFGEDADPLGIGGDGDVLFSRSADAGASWTSPLPLNDTATYDSAFDNPSGTQNIATDGDGNWMAVWNSNDPLDAADLGNDADIIYALSTDDGVSWSSPAPVNTTADSDSTVVDENPSVSTDGAGKWIVVWESELSGDLDIVLSRSDDLGATWSAPASLDTTPGVVGNDRVAGVENDGSNWVVVWRTEEEEICGSDLGSDTDLLVSSSADGGVTWSYPTPANTNGTFDVGSDGSVDLAFGAGEWCAVWSSDDSLDPLMLGTDGDILKASLELPLESCIGACCLGDGVCVPLPESECIGDYLGDGTICDPNPCPQGEGACCVGSLCSLETQETCVGAGGCYFGQGTFCDPSNLCPAYESMSFVPTIVDSDGIVGQAPSLVASVDGFPTIAFHLNGGGLKYSEASETGWETVVVDSIGDTGHAASHAIDLLGDPHITYFRNGPGDLYYAYRVGVDWFSCMIDGAAGEVGRRPSLALQAGSVHVVYADETLDSLSYAIFPQGSCAPEAISISRIPGTEFGVDPSLAFDPAGRPFVSFYHTLAKDLRLAYVNESDEWAVIDVDTEGDGGRRSSLAIDRFGIPYIAYEHESSGEIRLATRSNGDWDIATIDASGATPSLVLNVIQQARIAYHRDGELYYALQDGSEWVLKSLDSSSADQGRDPHVVLDTQGNPRIAYYDSDNDDLRYGFGSQCRPEVSSVPIVIGASPMMQLGRVRPNPSSSVIEFSVTLREASYVEVGVIDVSGRELLRLVDEVLPIGRHVFDTSVDGTRVRLASGRYFLRARAGAESQASPFVVAR